MKLKLIVIAVFILAVGTGMAKASPFDPGTTIVRKDSSSIYIINYSGVKAGPVTVTITDALGNVMIRKSIKNTKDFVMPVNFSSASEGKYLVQVDNGMEKNTLTVNYNNNTAPTYSRVWNLGDNRYMFQASHVGSEKISIRIYNETGDVVFEESKEIKGDFAMIFNLKNVTGKPSFEVSEASGNSVMLPGNPVVMAVKK